MLNTRSNPDCNKEIHRSFLCLSSLVKRLEFLSLQMPSSRALCNRFHSHLSDVLRGLCGWLSLTVWCTYWILLVSVPSAFGAVTFLTTSAPGGQSLYFQFPDPFSYLYYSLFHVSLACLSFSKRQKQCGFFSWHFTQSQLQCPVYSR